MIVADRGQPVNDFHTHLRAVGLAVRAAAVFVLLISAAASCVPASVRASTAASTNTSHTTSAQNASGRASSRLLASLDEPAFDITVRSSGTTAFQAGLLEQAAHRWEAAIVGDVPSSTMQLGAGACAAGTAPFSGEVDDVLIDIVITPIDGPSGILGQAGPCFIREQDSLPQYGAILLDSADAAILEAEHLLEAVLMHEIGHILGFGTLWQHHRSLLDVTNPDDPRFVGARATKAWRGAGGSGFVPVEGQGGGGTAYSHWDETAFQIELMTGYLDDRTDVDDANPVSAVTIAAMADLGYEIDPNATDPYALRPMHLEDHPAGAAQHQPFPELADTVPKPAPRP